MGDGSLTNMSKELALLKINAKRLIVAIDFGTTYSGIAYCFPGHRDAKPFAITSWPGSNVKAAKVPTVLKYDEQSHNEFKWGKLLEDTDHKVVGIKLLLDPDQVMPSHVSRDHIIENLRSLPACKSPKDVAADFMRAIKSHGMSYIATKVPQAALDLFEIEYVMSVPASWSDAAKNATLEAAKAAGITPVTLIKEPEAAALYSIRQLDMALDPQDVIVICDAGGGTVDLISYEVESTNPRLELKELVPGACGIVGSMFLDQKFREAVKERIPSDKWQSFRVSRAMRSAEKQFEKAIKLDFQGNLDDEFYVTFTGADLKDNPIQGLISNEWHMSGADVKKIFDPVIEVIVGLIREQVRNVLLKQKNVKAIFLVGGFGESQYLRQEVENAHRDIKVVQPEESWAAIVKGAALSKMTDDAVVTSVSAVRNYGVEASSLFNSEIDAGQPTFIDRHTGELQTCRMTWYIQMGNMIKRNQKIRMRFHRKLDENYSPSDAIFRHCLYECNEESAPMHKSKCQTIKQNCVLYSDVRSVPTSKFTKRFSPTSQALVSKASGSPSRADAHDGRGKPYWVVVYDLVISFESAVMTFSMEMDGETLGSVEAHFDR